jgi:hypothetical protein
MTPTQAELRGVKMGLEAAARLVWAASENCCMDMLIERYGKESTYHARDMLEAASEKIRAIDPAAVQMGE